MKHVLVVDDEELLREELKESLELEDYDVTTAESVPEALQRISETAFDAVVTDLKMPKIGGLDLLRQLKADRYPGITVVVSGHGAESNRDAALELGARAVFAKPLDVDELIDVLEA